jgi:hypothetical protein
MKRTLYTVAAILALSLAAVGQFASGVAPRAALQYNWQASIVSGNTSTGSASITLVGQPGAGGAIMPNGSVLAWQTVFPNLMPIVINDANAEQVTPTAVSFGACPAGNIGVGGSSQCVTITASFTYTHGAGAYPTVSDATYGAQTAANYLWATGGGNVEVDSTWAGKVSTNPTGSYASASAALAAMIPYSNVGIVDYRNGFAQGWQPTQSVATIIAAPTTLTSTTVGFGLNGANTTGGTYTGTSTYYYCVAYVDPMGNEGPCSATFSAATAGTGSTNQIGFAAPAASPGAVGYVPYISLASGSYNLTYQVPVTSTVCTMTKVQTVTPACAVTNTTYLQTGSNAVVSALTVNTAPLHLLKTTASTTSAYIGTPSGRTAYAYAPVGTVSAQGLTYSQQAFTVATAAATTVPAVIATIPVPTGDMNFPGRTLCVEGQATEATAGSTATVQNFEFLWDAAGSNTTGAPVIIGDLQLTATLVTANADNWSFHECFQTTVSGSSVTAGSIQPFGGQLISTYGAGVLGNAGTEVNVSAIGSLNLAGTGGNTQRLHVVWLHTTATDGAGVQVTALRSWWQ